MVILVEVAYAAKLTLALYCERPVRMGLIIALVA